MDELRKIPPVTRTLVLGTLAITLPVLAGLLPIYPLVYIPDAITRDWEVWRLFSGYFFGGKGIGLLFDMILLYRNSNTLEESHFQGRTADYAWALMLIALAIDAFQVLLGPAILFRPMLIAITHLWGQTNPTSQVSLFGLINVPAPYFPWAMIAMDFLNGGTPAVLSGFLGLAAAHLYFFMSEVYPSQSGRERLAFLSAPNWLVGQIGNGFAAPATGRAAPAADERVYRAGGGWGFRPTGQPLGGRPGNRAPTAPAPGADRPAGGARAGTTAREEAAGATHRWGGGGQRLGEE